MSGALAAAVAAIYKPAGGGAPAIVQSRWFSSTNGNGTTHDITLSSAATPGNTIIVILMGYDDVTTATVLGVAGPPSAVEDYSNTFASGRQGKAFRYSNAASGATGFRFTTSVAHLNTAGWILEISGLTNTTPFTGGGDFPSDFGPTELDAAVTVNAAGDICLAAFADVPLANITATRSGFTQSGDSNGSVLLQRNLNTGSGSITAGCTLSSNGFSSEGFVVSWKKA